MTVVLLAVGLALLIAGAELLVRGASRLALGLRVPPLLVGLTVVAFGTSAPELAVSTGASLSGDYGIALGNVVGSNTFNVLLILGVLALITPLGVSARIIRIDVPVMIGVSVALLGVAADGVIHRWEGLLLLVGFTAYLLHLIWDGRHAAAASGPPLDGGDRTRRTVLDVVLVIIGLALLILGSHWVVGNAARLAAALGVDELVVGLTLVAAGTSLPELATSVVAAIRGARDIAVGNIIGSNIFNILAIVGVSSTIAPHGLEAVASVISLDIPVMIGAAVVCLPVALSHGRIGRWEGALFVGWYSTYVLYLVLDATSHGLLDDLRMVVCYLLVPVPVVAALIHTLRSGRRATVGPRAPRWHDTRLLPVAAMLVLLAGALDLLLVTELNTSRLQSRLIHSVAREMSFELGEGPSPSIRFPASGPYDRRLGHNRIPQFIDSLTAVGFEITRQARMSGTMAAAMDGGLAPVYAEKDRAGLTILDHEGRPLFQASYPDRTYGSFDDIPPPLVGTLLFIENRSLLDDDRPYRNPAVEWGRFTRSVFRLTLRGLGGDGSVQGASTLATQLEKYRHSPDGVTADAREKLRQMAAAALRAYQQDRETLDEQRAVVLHYLNTVPLSAIDGYGEVNGIGAGLWAWFGMEIEDVSRLLRLEPETLAGPPGARGDVYRAVLTLLLAQSRPSYYLRSEQGRAALDQRVVAHLDLLEREGVVPAELARAAAASPVRPSVRPVIPPAPVSFVDRKGANAIRSHLLGLLDVERLYDLDRFDLVVESTVDQPTQSAVTAELRRLADPRVAAAAGMTGPRLLGPGDASRIRYAVLLMEATPQGNLVRVQTDNYEAPLDLNFATKLELGSTAKLRTLVTYLEFVEELYRQLAPLDQAGRDSVLAVFDDPLTRWAASWLKGNPDADVRAMLRAAMQRTYSASPAERFYTGGGVHTFANFDATYDSATLTVDEAFRNSVNLVFIRLMRDLVRYQTLRIAESGTRALAQLPVDSLRYEYLARFADREGATFVTRFYRKLSGVPRDSIVDRVAGARSFSPARLARVYRAVHPDADPGQLAGFLRSRLPDGVSDTAALRALYRRTDPKGIGWADLGVLAGVHPLELWMARELAMHPEARLADVLAASTSVRQDVYHWLFTTRRRGAQDLRIRTIQEVESFAEIGRAWHRLGYPFDELVPSLATAIGSSGDRPVALAELLGIILNDGVRTPIGRVESLAFAPGTPYETALRRPATPGERVLSSDVTAVLREALVGVVEHGSGRRASGAFLAADGRRLELGGKTGTGDNRYVVAAPDGRSDPVRVENRTATFAFFIGDRHYGVVTAFVEGPDARTMGFTSSLPVQLLRHLAPTIEPLLRESDLGLESDLASASTADRVRSGPPVVLLND